MRLFVGLGNIGAKYEETRHNVGFMVADELISAYNARDISSKNFKGALFKSSDILILKPHTYMNLSGSSVLAVKSFFKIQIQDIVVIHDDIDLDFGAIRYKIGGGDGGHNGLRSIDATMGKEYTRVRIGISRPEIKSRVSSYVLSEFTKDQKQKLPKIIKDAVAGANALLDIPLEEVRSRYTKKVSTSETLICCAEVF